MGWRDCEAKRQRNGRTGAERHGDQKVREVEKSKTERQRQGVIETGKQRHRKRERETERRDRATEIQGHQKYRQTQQGTRAYELSANLYRILRAYRKCAP